MGIGLSQFDTNKQKTFLILKETSYKHINDPKFD